jgi:hypothetical protein
MRRVFRDLSTVVLCPSDDNPRSVGEEECGTFPGRGPMECCESRKLREKEVSRWGGLIHATSRIGLLIPLIHWHYM